MNLVYDPWIPVTLLDGKPHQASLMDLFTAGEQYADMAVRPHERIALMRLLVCIGNAALDGPEDYSGMAEARRRLPEAAKLYLEKWKERFNLFDDKYPFLQRVDISKKSHDTTPASKMNFSFATGNNSSLFDHEGMNSENRKFDKSDLAIMLTTFLGFSPGGLIGKVHWCGSETKGNSSHAICTPKSMLHTFIKGSSVLGSVGLNLLTKTQIEIHYGNSSSWGAPVWESIPLGPDDADAIANATKTYIGRLVPLSRLIKLLPSGQSMLLGDGLDYPAFNEFPREPSATEVLNKDKTDRILLAAQLEKSAWRELHALVVRKKTDGMGGALALENIPDAEAFDLWVGALVADKASILDVVESVIHVPIGMRNDQGRLAYESEVAYAERIASHLGWAVEEFRKQSDGGWEGRLKSAGKDKGKVLMRLRSAASRYYWTAVEKSLDYLMVYADKAGLQQDASDEQVAWRKSLFVAACDAYRAACTPQTAREMKAFALGMSKLTGKAKTQQDGDASDADTTEIEEESYE
jgi:CRISPR system Cascade subunit CasA